MAEYRYDGLGHRVYKKVENSGDRDDEQYFYYNNRWQLLEIAGSDNKARQQFVWGTQYIDEAICMDVDTNSDGDCTDTAGSRHFFYCQDANWNVVALRENTASGNAVVERYEYDPYGTVRIYKGQTAADQPEQLSVTGSSLKWLDADLPENPVMYCGYFHDATTGKYYVRHRTYGLDRWLQRDPEGYRDGMNLYQYVNSRPTSSGDPTGECTIFFSCACIKNVVSGCHRDCTYKCTEKRRRVLYPSNILCDDRVLPPKGTAVIYLGDTKTDHWCKIPGCSLFHKPNPPGCDAPFEKYKIFTYDPSSKRNCSQSSCRKAIRGGGSVCNKFCSRLPKPWNWLCKGLCGMGGAVIADFCNNYCQNP